MPPHGPSRLTVVGIGDDGWPGLTEAVRERVAAAPVVVGGARHLAMLPELPELPGASGQERIAWPSPFSIDVVPDHAVVLASGDPLVSGVATTLIAARGRDAVEVVPHVSSVALARARMGWSVEECAVVSVVGRRAEAVLRELAPERRVLVLGADAATPAAVAELLVTAGYGASGLTVLGHLGGPAESVAAGTAASWGGSRADSRADVPALHVLALELTGPVVAGWTAGLPDDAYEHDGQLTKRDLRASALSRLAPQPGQHLWDVGAGAGSVGIEWLRAHPTCRATAIERDPARAARAAANAARLGVPGLDVRTGEALDVLDDLPDPHAIFVGGGATVPGLLDVCRERLRPGGRLVVHGVTLETEQVLAAAYAVRGGELTRIAVEHAAPIGGFTGWTPARAVTQWAWTKESA